MDDLLRSDPEAFKSLRTFQNRSFIQFDDKENNAFKAAILRRNESILLDPQKTSGNTIACNYRDTISKFSSHGPINNKGPQPIDLTTLIQEEAVNGALKKEMTVEVALLDALQHKEPQAISIFGTWDYLSHQVTSSPFKPIIYMDKIDVFGYRWIPGYEGHIISKYLVVEIKKGEARLDDKLPSKDYEQLMKYVDWVCDQYAHGDYTMIEAYLVANSFNFSNCSLMKQAITRSFVTGHDAKTTIWDNLSCVQHHAAPNGTISVFRV